MVPLSLIMRYLSALSIFALMAGLYLSSSGAPFTVDAVRVFSLALGFLLPALWVSSLAELERRKYGVLALQFVALLILDYGSSRAIVKYEFLDQIPELIFLGIGGLGLLMGIHLMVTELLSRGRNRVLVEGVSEEDKSGA